MPEIERVICLVADGLGVGALPDAESYGDAGANTLQHTAQAVGRLRMPNLEKLGLGLIGDFSGVGKVNPVGFAGRMKERSAGKDTTTGHWEISGIVTEVPQAVFPHGFPSSLLEAFAAQAKVPGVLGNKAASGTEIIKELGEEHLRTGKPIVYTSADSVFQIATHEQSFGLQRLYEVCRVARKLVDPFQVGRVIARPFVGTSRENFSRTENRRDFSLSPARNCLDLLDDAGVGVHSIGKIEDIFDHRGIASGNHTGNNRDSLKASLDCLVKHRRQKSFIFTNLVDFDMLFGHRRDAKGYAGALEAMDEYFPQLLSELTPKDILLLTADHGCDPTYRGTDHTREYVPLIAYRPTARGGLLGDRSSFADVASTVLEAFGVNNDLPHPGKSFLCDLLN